MPVQKLKDEKEEESKECSIGTATMSVMIKNGVAISSPKIVHSGLNSKKVGIDTIYAIENELCAMLKELLAQDDIPDGEFRVSTKYTSEDLKD